MTYESSNDRSFGKAMLTLVVGIFTIAAMFAVGVALAWWATLWIIPLWTWFITPVFGWQVPSTWMLIGLMMTVRTMFPNPDLSGAYRKDAGYWDKFGGGIITAMAGPPVAYIFGLLYLHFAG